MSTFCPVFPWFWIFTTWVDWYVNPGPVCCSMDACHQAGSWDGQGDRDMPTATMPTRPIVSQSNRIIFFPYQQHAGALSDLDFTLKEVPQQQSKQTTAPSCSDLEPQSAKGKKQATGPVHATHP